MAENTGLCASEVWLYTLCSEDKSHIPGKAEMRQSLLYTKICLPICSKDSIALLELLINCIPSEVRIKQYENRLREHTRKTVQTYTCTLT